MLATVTCQSPSCVARTSGTLPMFTVPHDLGNPAAGTRLLEHLLLRPHARPRVRTYGESSHYERTRMTADANAIRLGGRHGQRRDGHACGITCPSLRREALIAGQPGSKKRQSLKPAKAWRRPMGRAAVCPLHVRSRQRGAASPWRLSRSARATARAGARRSDRPSGFAGHARRAAVCDLARGDPRRVRSGTQLLHPSGARGTGRRCAQAGVHRDRGAARIPVPSGRPARLARVPWVRLVPAIAAGLVALIAAAELVERLSQASRARSHHEVAVGLLKTLHDLVF